MNTVTIISLIILALALLDKRIAKTQSDAEADAYWEQNREHTFSDGSVWVRTENGWVDIRNPKKE